MSKSSRHKIMLAKPSEPSRNHEAIEAMAYQLWLLRGCPIGSDQEDWYRAEAELKNKHQANQHAA